jgi:hypothetical protein
MSDETAPFNHSGTPPRHGKGYLRGVSASVYALRSL